MLFEETEIRNLPWMRRRAMKGERERERPYPHGGALDEGKWQMEGKGEREREVGGVSTVSDNIMERDCSANFMPLGF